MDNNDTAKKTPGLDRIILALDTADPDYALDLVDTFGTELSVFKVGLQLFVAAGPEIVREIHNRGKEVFLDLKFHDIPNTAASAAVAAARLGVFMLNVHASGGAAMMRETAERVVKVCLKENLRRPRLLGVTVLTSMGPDVLRQELSVAVTVDTQVKNLARMSKQSGLDGVVASAREARLIKEACGPDFLVVTPGIRPKWAAKDHQQRIVTPRDALRAGADYLVIGRAITGHEHPPTALKRLADELALPDDPYRF